MTAITSSFARMGIANAAFNPHSVAIFARGKFGSRVTSSNQAECFDFQTRPGRPSPGWKLVFFEAS